MRLTGNGIYLRFLEESDAASLASLNQRNRRFFEPFVTDRPEEFYTTEYQLTSIKTGLAMMSQDAKYSFGVFLQRSDELIGLVSLTEIVRGPIEACWLGYYLDREQNGHGYTTDAVGMVVRYAFETLNLHRIEAGVMPHNAGSIRVLEKTGFEREGLSKKNVLIQGRWQDHLHYAVVNPIRRARPDEAEELSAMVLASKGVWGYDEDFLEACRAELTLTPEYIASAEVFVFEREDHVVGIYSVTRDAASGSNPSNASNANLDLLYIAPGHMGEGYGKALWHHAVARAKALGCERLTIDADPHAEPFYLRMGAKRIGDVPSGSIAGRMLPQVRYDLA